MSLGVIESRRTGQTNDYNTDLSSSLRPPYTTSPHLDCYLFTHFELFRDKFTAIYNMLNKRMIRSSGVLFASIVCFLLWVLLHDRIYGEEHEEGDLARREEAAAGDKWNGKAPWLLGVDAEDEVPEPVVQMQTEEPAAPAAEITDAELEKMKIKDLKVGWVTLRG